MRVTCTHFSCNALTRLHVLRTKRWRNFNKSDPRTGPPTLHIHRATPTHDSTLRALRGSEMSASRIRAPDLRPCMHDPALHAPRGSEMPTNRIRAPDLRPCMPLAWRSRAIPRLTYRRRSITSAHRIVDLGSQNPKRDTRADKYHAHWELTSSPSRCTMRTHR